MIGRADIEGLKSNVAMNACAASQACYACGGGGGEGGYNETVQFEQRGGVINVYSPSEKMIYLVLSR